MIIYMFDKTYEPESNVVCVTNRSLCQEEFLLRIEKIAKAKPSAIILREKDMDANAYAQLAERVMNICRVYDVNCILHTFINVAIDLNAQAMHLPLHILRTMTTEQKSKFKVIGASCHSIEDAKEAQMLGCTYITAGHIFDTDCKKGLPGRGLEFLKSVCENVHIPVYAIGGIAADNIKDVYRQGAKGACIMKALMQCEVPENLIQSIDLKN